MDWDKLAKDLGGELLDALKDNLEGAKEDLKVYGEAIGRDIVFSIRNDRPDLKAELVEQAKALAEIHRIRLNNTTWDLVLNTVLRIASVARVALVAGGIAL